MLAQKHNKLSLKFFYIFIVLVFIKTFSINAKTGVCETLLEVLNINTNAYKNCLLKKSGDKYSKEELNACKKYYLTEIERLSYVYKNACK